MEKKKIKLLEIEQLPEAVEMSQISANQSQKYVFVARTHNEEKEKILIVTFFSLKTKIADFRVFFNKEKFITEKLQPERKWSESTLDSLITYWYGRSAACANEESSKTICSFFGKKENPYYLMVEFQQNIRKRRLEERHKKETDKIDEYMKTVPKLPANFKSWVNDTVFNKSRYIYYKKINSTTIEAFCTSCLKPVSYQITKTQNHSNIRHNKPGKCPLCGKSIIYKATGKTTLLVDYANAAIMQKTTKGFVIRYFSVTKEYKDHYKKPSLSVCEEVRDFHEDEKIKSYEYDNFKQTGKMRWCNSSGHFCLDTACLYTRNIRYVLADTAWKYSCIYELAKNRDSFNIYGYLRSYKNYPAYEYLIKLKLYNLVADDIDSYGSPNYGFNFEGKNIQEVLGIDRQGLNQLQRLNGDYEHLSLIKEAANAGIQLKDKEIDWAIKTEVRADRFVSLTKYTTVHKVIKYISSSLGLETIPDNYIQSHWLFGSPVTNFTRDWLDYLDNCTLLRYDTKNSMILFPKNLKARHDEVAERVDTEKNKIYNRAVSEMRESLEKEYVYKDKTFIIRPPKSADEIIKEGQVLRHCVGTGSYIKDMAKGEGIILFVRRTDNPEEPFYTLELSRGRIVQCRGKKNSSMTKDVKKFLDKWQDKVLRTDAKVKSA